MSKEGWGHIHNSRKWHYFRERQSLCNKWGIFPGIIELEQGNDDSSDNCAACKRKLAKEREQ